MDTTVGQLHSFYVEAGLGTQVELDNSPFLVYRWIASACNAVLNFVHRIQI